MKKTATRKSTVVGGTGTTYFIGSLLDLGRIRTDACAQKFAWEYRVVFDGMHHYIVEVHFDAEGRPHSWTDRPARPTGETYGEMVRDLASIVAALGKHVLIIRGDRIFDHAAVARRAARRVRINDKAELKKNRNRVTRVERQVRRGK
jgi:hypothetical protein